MYQKGIALGKKAMQAVESRLARHPDLPVGYSDPSSFCTVMRDILFEKSPKAYGNRVIRELCGENNGGAPRQSLGWACA